MSLGSAAAVAVHAPGHADDVQPPSHRAPILDCSVGIMAFNEEANIANAVESILAQDLKTSRVAELIVVASGCADRTAEIVAALAERDPRVRLIEQPRREGKASAINLFLVAARSPVLLMMSADVVAHDGALEKLLCRFADPDVGMVGGHPMPVNSESTFLGHTVHLQWRLHDRIAKKSPKLGEIVAFRNVVPSIPVRTAVDEISIQALITQLGYLLVYEPDAMVYNRGPTTVADFLRQRRRIHGGHLRVREQQGYAASTMRGRTIARAVWGSGSFATPRVAMWSLGAVGLEVTARALGHLDELRGRSAHVWDISRTTKEHIPESATADDQQNVVVFHVVNFHRLQIQLGLHASRQLVRRAAARVERALGPDALVCIRHSGTIVAVLPGDREAAERAAHDLVREATEQPQRVNGRADVPAIKLAYGIIAFPSGRPPSRASATGPVRDVALAPPSAA